MADPRKGAKALVSDVHARLGDRLRSAVLYGSVARGEAIEGVSDINVLILLDHIDTVTLAQLAPVVAPWAEQAGGAPLLVEEAHWPQAADAFAIELADMRDAHELLAGYNCVAGEDVDPRALRLQTEKELRGKLLQLQTGLMMAGNDGNAITQLLVNSVPSFATYARAIIRLNLEVPPTDTVAVLGQVAQIVGADAAPLIDVWNMRADRKPMRRALSDPIVSAYHSAIENMANYVDSLGRQS